MIHLPFVLLVFVLQYVLKHRLQLCSFSPYSLPTLFRVIVNSSIQKQVAVTCLGVVLQSICGARCTYNSPRHQLTFNVISSDVILHGSLPPSCVQGSPVLCNVPPILASLLKYQASFGLCCIKKPIYALSEKKT